MNERRVRIIEIFFLLILAVLSFGFYRVMQPFILNIFLAAIFTSVLSPMHGRLMDRIGERRTLATIIMILLAFVVIAVPVSIIGVLVYSEAVSGYNAVVSQVPQITESLAEVSLLDWARELPLIGEYFRTIEPIELSEMLRDAVRAGSDFVLNATQRSFVNAGVALANFVLMLLLMFFFFQSGQHLLASIYDVVPMPNRELREIADETRRTTTATLISTLLIGLIEGSFGVTLFALFGLPSPFLWGLITMVVSMIPLIGSNLVLVPAGVILIISGRIGGGVLLALLGVAGITITQNVVKPKLLGDRAGLNPALALLATLGGIAWLGLIGFLVGPLIASLFIVVWQQFATRYRDELATRDESPTDAPATEVTPASG